MFLMYSDILLSFLKLSKDFNKSSPYHIFKDIIKKYNATVTDDEKKKHPDIPLHGLRHTSATLLISENVDVRTVSARLDHAQTSTTMNIYAHSLKKLNEKALNRVLFNFIKSPQTLDFDMFFDKLLGGLEPLASSLPMSYELFLCLVKSYQSLVNQCFKNLPAALTNDILT